MEFSDFGSLRRIFEQNLEQSAIVHTQTHASSTHLCSKLTEEVATASFVRDHALKTAE